MNYAQHIINTIYQKASPDDFFINGQNGFQVKFSNTSIFFNSYGSHINTCLQDLNTKEKINLSYSFEEIKPILEKFLNSSVLQTPVPTHEVQKIRDFLRYNEYSGKVSHREKFVSISPEENSPQILLGRLLYSGTKPTVHMLSMLELYVAYYHETHHRMTTDIILLPGWEIKNYPYLKPWLDVALDEREELERAFEENKKLSHFFNIETLKEKNTINNLIDKSITAKNVLKI